MAAADALLAVSVELEGGRIVHQSFISADVAKACGNVGHLWEKVASSLEPEALAKCGSMRKVLVLAAPAATHPVGFCMRAENSVASILDMGVTAVKFEAAKPVLPAPLRPLGLVLNRAPALPRRSGLSWFRAVGEARAAVPSTSKVGTAVLWLWPSREREEKGH